VAEVAETAFFTAVLLGLRVGAFFTGADASTVDLSAAT
jgi:hypothetical protein